MIPPRLVAIVDLGALGGDQQRWLDTLARLAALADTGLLVQLRAKGLAPAARRALFAEGVRRAREAGGAAVAVNGSTALAAELQADGVHWPEAVIPARPEAGAGSLWRAASVHGRPGLLRARAAGAHWVQYGPVFAPGSKAGEAVGVAALRAFADASPLPVIAVGGVNDSTAPACLRAGAAGVAAVSAIVAADDPAAAARRLLHALRR